MFDNADNSHVKDQFSLAFTRFLESSNQGLDWTHLDIDEKVELAEKISYLYSSADTFTDFIESHHYTELTKYLDDENTTIKSLIEKMIKITK
jgi:hypothetical protein